MQSFYLGIDVSKGHADFVIIDQPKKSVIENFQPTLTLLRATVSSMRLSADF